MTRMNWICITFGHSFQVAYDEIPRPIEGKSFKGFSEKGLREFFLTRTVKLIYCKRCGEEQ